MTGNNRDRSLKVLQLEAARFDEWDLFVESATGGSIYSTTRYLDLLCRATNGRFEIYAVLDDDGICGGVALYQEERCGVRYISPRLLLYYNGIVLKRCDSGGKELSSKAIAIAKALASALANLKVGRLLLNNSNEIFDVRPFLQQHWQALPGYSYVVPLKDMAEAWNRIDKNLRRLIRRATEAAVSFGEDDDFTSFYQLHRETHDRKGAPLYLPEARFGKFVADLRSLGLAKLFQARLPDGNSIAAQLVLLGKHPIAHTVCAGASEAALDIGANPFLRWRSFEALASLGYQGNDLTDAALNSVTQFKSHLGGELVMNIALCRPDRISYRALELARRIYGKSSALPKKFFHLIAGTR